MANIVNVNGGAGSGATQVIVDTNGNINVTVSRSVIGTVANVPSANYANFANVANIANTSNLATSLNATISNVHISGGANGYVLQTDGAGNLSWSANGGGGGTPGGSNTQVQFNDDGAFGGDANLAFNKTTGTLTATNYSGNGSGLSNLTGANVTGTVANATYATTADSANTAATVTTNAQPNITSVGTLTSVNSSGNITAPNVVANTGAFYGNAAGLTNIPGGNVSGTVANALVAGTVYTNAQPNITSVGTLTSVNSSGNITGPNVVANTGAFYGNAAGLTNIPGGNVSGTVANATHAINADNATTAGTVTANAQPNITSVGTLTNLDISGNLTSGNANLGNLATANYFQGDGGLLTNISATGGSQIANGTSNVTIPVANSNVEINIGEPNFPSLWLSANGAPEVNIKSNANISIGNSTSVLATFFANSNGPEVAQFLGGIVAVNIETQGVFIGSGANLTNIPGANVSGIVANATYATTADSANTAETVTTNAQPNITSVGTLSSLAVTGNVTAANFVGRLANGNSNVNIPAANSNVTISAVGTSNVVVVTGTGVNIAGTLNTGAGVITGNGSGLSAIAGANVTGTVANATAANTILSNTSTTTTVYPTFVSAGANGFASLLKVTGISANLGNNAITATTFVGALSGTATSATSATNAAALLQNTSTATTVYPTFTTSSANGNSQAVFNSSISANLGNASITATTFVGALSGTATSATTAGTVTTAAQPNITSVGTLTSLDSSGNITGPNVIANTGAFYGNAAGLTNIPAGNINGQVANALVAGTVYTAAQPNITSVGTLTSLDITGNLTSGNANLGNLVKANYFQGDGGLLSNITVGAGSSITNGNSNVIVTANGNVNTSVSGVANVFVVTNTGANIAGNLDATGTISANVINANYVNANVNLANVNSIYFDTANGVTPTTYGQISWNDGEGVPEVLLKGGNTSLNIGAQEIARVYNADTVTLNKGSVVYVFGAQGNRISVKRALATTDATSAGTLGFVTETITAGSEGYVQTTGPLFKIDTSGTTAGALVYLSPTTAGAWTTTKPAAPDHTVILGYIERVDNTVGSIYVKVNNGYELDELHNVLITSPVAGQALVYNSSNLWVNGNAEYSNTAGTVITAAQPNITSTGTLTSVNSSGNITGPNVVANTGAFYGNAAGLTNIPGANVTGQVANALVAGTVYTAAQPNITSVGTLTGLTVSGTSNLSAVGNVIITGGSAGQYLQTDGAGNLSWQTVSGGGGGSNIANGTSNVNIATSAGDVTVSVNGTSNTVVFGNINTTINTPIRTANTVIIGNGAGNTSVLANGHVAIGYQAGKGTQTGLSSIAIGYQAGQGNQSDSAVAIGYRAGNANQYANGIAIGTLAGANSQADESIAIGALAGQNSQQGRSIAVGYRSGNTTQGYAAVAIGETSGFNNQGAYGIAVGSSAGTNGQDQGAVAIGASAGSTAQGANAVAIGRSTGISNQSENAIAIGWGAGETSQGANSIAIGALAGNIQAASSIVLNATGNTLPGTDSGATYIKPLRNVTSDNFMMYDNTSGEVSYYSISNYAGNIASGNANLGNAATANFFIGDGGLLSNIVATGGSQIDNGTSNVKVTASGNVNTSVAGNANVFVVTGTGANVAGTLQVSGVSNLGPVGNVVITGGSAGQYLQTDGSGTLSWQTVSGGGGASISNGTSNVNIATSGGNVTTSVAGNVDIFTVTGTGVNISGTFNSTGIVTAQSNIVVDGSITRTASNSNVTIAPTGTGVVDVSNKKISNLATPTANTDASTKLYVDNAVALKVDSNTAPVSGSNQILNMIRVTQAQYDGIGTPDSGTLYVIVG